MRAIKLFQVFVIFFLIKSMFSKDISTLSNYEDIPINYIHGDFKPDFDKEIVYGDLNYNLQATKDGNQIILDTMKLNITQVYNLADPKEEIYEPIPFSFGEEDAKLGTPLIIELSYKKEDYILIRIEFETTKEGGSAQFLSKEQTFGKQHPYFFTQSALILGRSLFPCQDTPAVKFQFSLSIIVPKELKGMISGIFRREEEYPDPNFKKYNYKEENDVPSYLVALAAGNIERKNITENMAVFSEPEYIDYAFKEVKDDLPLAMKTAIDYMGPYHWEQYNILVLPRSFPYSGMENPSLSFLSPCLINGDKSLIDIIFHEMIHSWSKKNSRNIKK